MIKQYRFRLEEAEILDVFFSQVQLHPGNYYLHSCVSLNPSPFLSPLPTCSPKCPLAWQWGVVRLCDAVWELPPSLGLFCVSCLSVAALSEPAFLADTQGSTAPAPEALGIKRQTGTQIKKGRKLGGRNKGGRTESGRCLLPFVTDPPLRDKIKSSQ